MKKHWTFNWKIREQWLPVYVKLLTTKREYNDLTKIVLDFLSINLKIILDLQR